MTTNYYETLITPSADCPAGKGEVPSKPGTIAALQHELLVAKPYGYTSDELLFAVHAIRGEIAEADWQAEKSAFFAKPKACLRASPLVKQFGWGLHHDANGRVALVSPETDAYRDIAARADIKMVPGMRSKRA